MKDKKRPVYSTWLPEVYVGWNLYLVKTTTDIDGRGLNNVVDNLGERGQVV